MLSEPDADKEWIVMIVSKRSLWVSLVTHLFPELYLLARALLKMRLTDDPRVALHSRDEKSVTFILPKAYDLTYMSHSERTLTESFS